MKCEKVLKILEENKKATIKYLNNIAGNQYGDSVFYTLCSALREKDKNECYNAALDGFVCSKCNIAIVDPVNCSYIEDTEPLYFRYEPSYCPECGRKVVE